MSTTLQTVRTADGATGDQASGNLKNGTSEPVQEGSWNPERDILTTPDGRPWGPIGIVEKGRRRKNQETRYPESEIWGSALYPLKHPVESYTEEGVGGKIRTLRVKNPKDDPYHPIIDVWDLGETATAVAKIKQLLAKRIAGTTVRMGNLVKATEEHQHENGKSYYSRRKSVEYMKVQGCPFSGSTLDRAQKKVNSLLGHLLQTEKFPNWADVLEKCNLKDDLDAMIKKHKELSGAHEDTNPLSTSGVCETIGVSRMTLNKMLPEGAKTTETALGVDGRVINGKRIDPAEIAAIAKYRGQPTIPQAAGILGVDRSFVDNLIGRGFLTVLPDPYGNQRSRRVDRAAVAMLMKGETSDSDEALDISTVEDEHGQKKRYWPFSAIKIRLALFPNATLKILYTYINKPCPQLGGDVLHALPFAPNPNAMPRPGKRKRRHEPVLKWLETDLVRLECPKVGKPGQEMAKAAKVAAPAAVGDREPATVGVGGGNDRSARRSRRGPRRSQITQEVYTATYDLLADAKGYSRTTIRRMLADKFKDPKYAASLPKQDSHVSEYARRRAEDPDDPKEWPIPGRRS